MKKARSHYVGYVGDRAYLLPPGRSGSSVLASYRFFTARTTHQPSYFWSFLFQWHVMTARRDCPKWLKKRAICFSEIALMKTAFVAV